MSLDGEGGVRHEIVIVRRRGHSEDEGHHGAAWKIAYADFMTAMMAFFLVMWLVNAADKKQIVAVASYFNPIKLSDKVTSPKGVHKADLSEAAETSSEKPSEVKKSESNKMKDKLDEATGAHVKAPGQDKSKKPDAAEGQSALVRSGASKFDAGHGSRLQDAANEEMFRDPYGMLTRLAADLDLVHQPVPNAPLATPQTGIDISSDPFDVKSGGQKAGASAPATEASASAKVVVLDAVTADRSAALAAATAAPAPGKQKAPAVQSPPVDKILAETKQIAQEIEHAVQGLKSKDVPAIEVARVAEGIMISLTDKSDFGMFDVGSAVPRPELIRVLGAIGKTLSGFAGQLAVRGHTDARAYRSETYDNWRLSTSRAHAAYFMLVRGGLDEKRVVRIEGYADRIPKNTADPLAPTNRRIEVLLKE